MNDIEGLLRDHFGVAEDELRKATLFQHRNDGKLEQILVRLGALSSEQLPFFYSKVFALPLHDDVTLDESLWEQLHPSLRQQLLQLQALPLSYEQETQQLSLLVKDP